VNKAAEASSKFREASDAYEVLSDPQRRKMYDQFGQAGPGGGFGGYGQPGSGGGPRGGVYEWSGQGGQGVRFEDIFGGGQGFAGMSLDDIMEALGGGRRGGRRGRAEPMPQDLESHVNLDFLQAVRGTMVSVRLQGEGVETINVRIPAGVNEGSRVRVRGKGINGGDLFIVTHVGPHPYFRRDGEDIYVDLPIGITEATLGAKVDVPTLEGTSTITIPPGSSSGRKLRLRGKGVSGAGGKTGGDQYVVLKIVVPPQTPPKAAELLREFDQIANFDPRADVPWKR
jgi:curved DNA-binding protein